MNRTALSVALGPTPIPVEEWARDHWSLVLYINIVALDSKGFEIGLDAKMRTQLRTFVELKHQPKPQRPGLAHEVSVGNNPTKLKDTLVNGHDDWCCLYDLASAGYFTTPAEELAPKVVLQFSAYGRQVLDALQEHKRQGQSYQTFVPPTRSL